VKVKVREDTDGLVVDETAAPMQRFTASQVHTDVLHEHEGSKWPVRLILKDYGV
jgi:hypothetical protein